MERRFTIFLKIRGVPGWIEHIWFFTEDDAHRYALGLKARFSNIEDYYVCARRR